MRVQPGGGRGLALIIVVGVLGVMAALAAAFVTMAQLERKASQQRVNAAKAWLLARSGIEDAQARLALGQDPTAFWNRYFGEDWNADGVLNAGPEADGEVYHKTGAGSTPDTEACPLKYAMRPSFSRMVAGNPRTVSVDGRARGYSGRLSGDYLAEGNHYALKVPSPSGGFYVNGGDPASLTTPGGGSDPSATSDYNTVLRSMLGTLAEALDREDGHNDGRPVTQADGWKLIDERPAGGWTSYDQIRDTAFSANTPAVRQRKIDALQPYLTLSAWVDKRVIHPNAVNAMFGSRTSWSDIKLHHDTYPVTAPGTRRAPDFERVPVSPTGKLVGRAPVDLSWARQHKPALIALLSGLRGFSLEEDLQSVVNSLDHIGRLTADTVLSNTWSAGDDCHVVADAIFTSTSELATWQEFNDFCDTIPGLTQSQRDVLKANFNPNTDLNKFNPNPSLWKTVDKSDLLAYSTEFSLFPLQAQDVESIGRVLDRNGRLLAQRTLRASLAAPSVARLTTQKEFVCDDLGALDAAGDESAPRLPGHPRFISQSRGVDRTWGHRLDVSGLSPSSDYAATWMTGDSQGASLQSYPEPCFSLTPGSDAGLAINPADYDGNLQLATLETRDNDFYGVDIQKTPPSVLTMGMLARFDDGLDLDLARSGDKALVPDARQAPVGNSLLDASAPNLLYPDGCYSEEGRAPAWHDKASADGYHGLLSFWMKPNYRDVDPGDRGRRYVAATNFPVGGSDKFDSLNQFFFLGDAHLKTGVTSTDPARRFVAHFEIGSSTSDPGYEAQFYTDPRATLAHRWYLLTFDWDFRADQADNLGQLLVDAGQAASDQGARNAYVSNWGSPPPSPASASAGDLTADGASGAHLLILGNRLGAGEFWVNNKVGGGADATFDEFALYDFGGAPAGGGPLPPEVALAVPTLAQSRYSRGRYYKGAVYRAVDDVFSGSGIVNDEAASYLTAPIRLPAGSVLRKIYWTWYRSSDAALAQDYAQVELVTPAGDQYLWPGSASNGKTDGDRQSWMVNQAAPGDFRARVVFLRPPVSLGGPDLTNTPILDSPVFDDLTFLYLPPGGARMTAWGDRE